MKKMGFVINGARCNGCGACLVACKVEHGITETGTWLRTRYENRATQALLTMGCNHCDEPACMKICPVKAYSKDDDGLVIQDHAKCIGCKACIAACPWHKPAFSEKDGKTHKCDFCARRLAKGLPPACVAACANRAIEYGLMEDLRAKYPDAVEKGWEWARKNFGLAGPGRTHPNVVIVPLETKVN